MNKPVSPAFVPLGEVLQFQRGFDLPSSQRIAGAYPVISSSGISGSHNQYKVQGENVLTGRCGTIGEVYYYNGGCWPLNTALFVKDFKGNSPKYIYYLLKCVLKVDGKDKSTVPGVDRNVLHMINVPYFRNIAHQTHIVEILESIDRKIEQNNQVMVQLEAMAQTLYAYWFVQFDFPDKHGAPYRHNGGAMEYNLHLKQDIPKGWQAVALRDIVQIFDSQRIPLSKKERNLMKGDIPYYGATGVMDYVNRHLFEGQYVLLAEDGSVQDRNGFPIVQMIWEKAWINNHAHVLRGCSGYGNELLYLMLKQIPVVNIMTGSIQKKINQDNLLSYPVLNIPPYLLESTTQLLKPIFEQTHLMQKETSRLTQLRDWLLPMLINGQATIL